MFRKIVAGRHGSCEPRRPERAGFAAVVAAVAADLFCGIRVIAGIYGICGVGGFFDVALHAAVVVAVSTFFGHGGAPPLGLIWFVIRARAGKPVRHLSSIVISISIDKIFA
jgi:hypothetical protein